MMPCEYVADNTARMILDTHGRNTHGRKAMGERRRHICLGGTMWGIVNSSNQLYSALQPTRKEARAVMAYRNLSPMVWRVVQVTVMAVESKQER